MHPTPPTGSSKTSWRVRLLALAVVAVGLVALLFIAEGVMRRLRPDLIPSHQLASVPDPQIGWRFKPSQQRDGWDEHGHSRRIRINSAGFNDREHSVEKPKGATRIAFLGDSFTAAVGVDFDSSFVRVFEKGLRLPDRRYEVLNFGMPSYGTASEYLCWRHVAAAYKPDLVILAFFIGNDVANQLPGYPQSGPIAERFEVKGAELLERPPADWPAQAAPGERPRGWLYRTFLAPSVLYQQYKLFERDARARAGFRRSRKSGGEELPLWKRPGVPLEWQTYLPEHEPEFEEAWNLTEALLRRLNQETRRQGAAFRVVLIPGIEALDPAMLQAGAVRYPGMESLKFDVEYPRRRLADFLKNENIPWMDMADALRAAMKTTPLSALYFIHDQHLSPKGHGVVGDELLKSIPSRLDFWQLPPE